MLARYDDISLPKSATICYTAALLKARAVADRFSAGNQLLYPFQKAKPLLFRYSIKERSLCGRNERRRGDTSCGRVQSARAQIFARAKGAKFDCAQALMVKFYSIQALIMPPEHILKRGDSEAVAYAFWHMQHWKRIDGALELLHCTWEGTFRMIPYPLEKVNLLEFCKCKSTNSQGHLFYPYPSCTEAADRELLPSWHDVSVYPRRDMPFLTLITAGLCSGIACLVVCLLHCSRSTATAVMAILTHQYPKYVAGLANACLLTLQVYCSAFKKTITTFYCRRRCALASISSSRSCLQLV